eukprot:CAMPEP_0201593172 /NCGR_PEP_ID=MMETSP0190_2-20130828/190868_1 /ASSEMBLY_ACC=CAM_ASM_000263 /TAXON_ID=37353 /ORGANISM="Rosalina sp." /LENGTH=162 /DNA_ID=CAMNT_0048052277 /DNA_START=1197 /DNA_END=1686 /DNA_ORIENTATION=+
MDVDNNDNDKDNDKEEEKKQDDNNDNNDNDIEIDDKMELFVDNDKNDKNDKNDDNNKDKMDVDKEEEEESKEKEDDNTESIKLLFSGYYELCGIVTHKGRSANSGHYIGYAKDKKRNKWLKYDDEDVTEIKSDDIKQLYGGGDFQMGVLVIYRRMEIEDISK